MYFHVTTVAVPLVGFILQWIMVTWFDYMLLSYLQFVVGLGDKVSPTDIEEGMRVGYILLLLLLVLSQDLVAWFDVLLWFVPKKSVDLL